MIPCFLAGSRCHSLRLAAEEEGQVWGIAMASGGYARMCTHTHMHVD